MRLFLASAPYDWTAVLKLVQSAFAYMEGRIDPPSSMHRLTTEVIAKQAETGEVWMIEDQETPVACVFLTRKPHALYIGKLAVALTHRNRGLARQLLENAAIRAQELGFDRLELETRIELIENHELFARLGFVRTGINAHTGYARPTSITMQKNLSNS